MTFPALGPKGRSRTSGRWCFYRREQVHIPKPGKRNRLHADLALISPGYKKKITGKLTRPRALGRVMRLISRDRSVRADIARRRIRTLRELIATIAELDTQIGELVEATGAVVLTGIYGVGTVGAGEILAEVGDPTKYPTKSKFAMANGTAPLQASSGRIRRHRLNRGGNRQLNRTVHIAALTQIRPQRHRGPHLLRQTPRPRQNQKEAMRHPQTPNLGQNLDPPPTVIHSFPNPGFDIGAH